MLNLSSEKKIDKQELMFLLTGGVGLQNNIPNPAPNWLLDKSWDEICRLDDLNTYHGKCLNIFDNRMFLKLKLLFIILGIKNNFIAMVNDWKNYYELTDHDNSKFPNPWYDKLSEFQRILIVRAVRPDKVIPVIIKLIKTELGEKFIHPPPFDINKSYSDSICLSPLIFILSPGVDPMANLLQFANQMDKGENLHSVSLGQGQVNNEMNSK